MPENVRDAELPQEKKRDCVLKGPDETSEQTIQEPDVNGPETFGLHRHPQL
jgi:hypothetical protein